MSTSGVRDNCGSLVSPSVGLVCCRLASGFPWPEMPIPQQASKQLLATGGLCWGHSTSASQHAHVHTQAQGVSSGIPPLLLSSSPTVVVPSLSCRSRHSTGFPLQWVSTPQSLAYCSPTQGTLLLSLLGCVHTTNPSPLLGTDLQSLNLSTQPPPKCLRLWCLCQWFR